MLLRTGSPLLFVTRRMLNEVAKRGRLPLVGRPLWLELSPDKWINTATVMDMPVEEFLTAVTVKLEESSRVQGLRCYDVVLAHPEPFKRVLWSLTKKAARSKGSKRPHL